MEKIVVLVLSKKQITSKIFYISFFFTLISFFDHFKYILLPILHRDKSGTLVLPDGRQIVRCQPFWLQIRPRFTRVDSNQYGLNKKLNFLNLCIICSKFVIDLNISQNIQIEILNIQMLQKRTFDLFIFILFFSYVFDFYSCLLISPIYVKYVWGKHNRLSTLVKILQPFFDLLKFYIIFYFFHIIIQHPFKIYHLQWFCLI